MYKRQDIDIVLKSVYYMDMYNDIAGKSADEYKAYVLERLPSIRKEIAQSPYLSLIHIYTLNERYKIKR